MQPGSEGLAKARAGNLLRNQGCRDDCHVHQATLIDHPTASTLDRNPKASIKITRIT